MKLYTYVVKHDTGLAPNPFGDWCSVAVCTPNHQGIRAGEGDWICGFSPKRVGHKLVYAMQVEECPNLDQYFRDERWAYKKPSPETAERRCGDNFYERLPDGKWKQHWNHFHRSTSNRVQDTRRPIVFVGRKFWYFGENQVALPDFGLSIGGRGVRVAHPVGSVDQFTSWLVQSFSPGRYGLPSHHVEAQVGMCAGKGC